jgi:hypothetical protein
LTHGFKAEKMLRNLKLQREVVCDDQSGNGVEALGRSKLTATGDDGDLLALEAQLDDLVAQLLAAQKVNGEPMRVQINSQLCWTVREVVLKACPSVRPRRNT